MRPLSQRAQSVPTSGIRTIMELAARLPDVIHLEVGEPDAVTPEPIIQAAVTAARAGFTKYTATAGLTSLREALVQKIRLRNDLRATVGQVVATPGSVFALASAVLAIIEQGDEALIPDPGWPNYASMLILAGASIVPYPLVRETGYQPDLAALAGLITVRTKLLVINSPANPTGAVFPPEVVRALVELAARHDLYLIADEVYEEFVYEGEHVPAARFDRDGRVVSVFGFSKSYAMTGWRVGYALASPEVAAMMARLAEPFVSCPSSVSQKAAEAALAGSQGPVVQMRESYRARRDAVVEILGSHGLLASVPHGAFYALVDLSRVSTDSMQLARQLLEEQRVATAPGETFGRLGAGLVRISFAAERSLLEEGCRRIVQYARPRVDA